MIANGTSRTNHISLYMNSLFSIILCSTEISCFDLRKFNLCMHFKLYKMGIYNKYIFVHLKKSGQNRQTTLSMTARLSDRHRMHEQERTKLQSEINLIKNLLFFILNEDD